MLFALYSTTIFMGINIMVFVVYTFEGKPAILDTVALVWYTGFKSYRGAQEKADIFNKGL